jgi:hypothetical protein
MKGAEEGTYRDIETNVVDAGRGRDVFDMRTAMRDGRRRRLSGCETVGK